MKIENFLIFVLAFCVLGADAGCRRTAKHNLQASKISDAIGKMGGASHVSTQAKIRGEFVNQSHLGFRNAKDVNDNSLQHLKNLDGIVGIDLSGTNVSDKGMKVLTTLPDLRYLQLADTKVSDRGISFLESCPKLSHLDIRRTKVTKAAEKSLLRFRRLAIIYTLGTPIKTLENKSVKINSDDDLETNWGGKNLNWPEERDW